jgi:hypothetical protein
MMKKVLLLALVIASYSFASAQQTVDLPKNYKDFPSTDQFVPRQGAASKSGGSVNGWYSPDEFIRNNATGPFTSFVSIMFPDSTVVNVNQDNEVNSVFSHAWGHLFDLRHDNWAAVPSDPNFPIQIFAQKDNYTWDSLAFRYLYRRNYPDANVVDTCFITYYKNSIQGQIRNGSILFGSGDTMLNARPVGLDQNALSGTAFFDRDTILLRPEDTTTFNPGTGWGSRYAVVPVGTAIAGTNATAISRNPPSWFAATMTFKPGHPWNPGDTVESRGFNRPANGINYFGYGFVTIEQANGGLPVTLRSRNYADNSLILYSQTRYGQTTPTNWDGFMPGTAFNSPIFADVQAFVSGTSTISVREVEELGLSLGKVYPNPANTGQSVFIEYAVKNTTNVTIEVYDMLGKKVATVLNNERVEAGEHKAAATFNLEPGIYFYNLSSGNTAISSQKFTVIR